jgi:hypothetical protein
MNNLVQNFATSNSRPDLNDENFENLKRIKELYTTYFRSPNLSLTWENINVYKKKNNGCFSVFNKQKQNDNRSLSKNDEENGQITSNGIDICVLPDGSNGSINLSNGSRENTDSSITNLSSQKHTKKSSENEHILYNASGIVRSGECLAIMGARLVNILFYEYSKNLKKILTFFNFYLSGAGKTIQKNYIVQSFFTHFRYFHRKKYTFKCAQF